MTDICVICLQQDKPCQCEAPTMQRPDVIPSLKHIAQKAYDAGHWDSTIDTIEETIIELERLRQTVTALKDENSHLRAMNQRVISALAEQMPIQGFNHSGEIAHEHSTPR